MSSYWGSTLESSWQDGRVLPEEWVWGLLFADTDYRLQVTGYELQVARSSVSQNP